MAFGGMKMKKNHELKGLIPAIVTPLNKNGDIDTDSQKKLIDNVMNSGCTGVMILGTVGEGLDVDRKTYKNTIINAVKAVDQRGLVIAGTGNVLYEDIEENIKIAADAGADIELNIPPFYHKLPQKIIYDFFMRLAEDSELPIMIYNMPELTKNNIDLNTVEKLKKHKNIVGIKDSSGNLIYFQQLVSNMKSDEFSVF